MPVSTSHVSDKIVFRAVEKVDVQAEIRRLQKVPCYSKPAIKDKMGFKLHKIDYSQTQLSLNQFACIADDESAFS